MEMQAIRLKGFGPDSPVLTRLPVPEPGRGEVRVKVAACGANASDWEFAVGRPFYGRLARLMMRVRVPGSDVAGTIEALGPGVRGLAVGDRVVADTFESFGGFAEFCVAKAERWVPLPGEMDFTTAAALPQSGAIALTAFEGLAPGARVLINGAGGGSGPLAIRLAKHMGAEVWATDNAAKQAVMAEAGADRCLDYRQQDFARLGERFDYILDLYGTRPMGQVRTCLRPGGRYAMVGGPMGTLLACALTPGPTGLLMVKQGPEATARMVKMVARGEITQTIGACVPLAAGPDALRRMGAGEIAGKLVLTTGA